MAKNLLSMLLLRLGQSGWMPLASCDLMREWEIPTIIMRKTKQICIDPAIKVRDKHRGSFSIEAGEVRIKAGEADFPTQLVSAIYFC